MRQKVRTPVFRISAAPRSLKEDVRSREVRYLVSMGVRTVCFLGAFLTQGVVRWLLVVAAFILPYIAVVVANAGRDRRSAAFPAFVPSQNRQLPEGPNHTAPQKARRDV
jgi:Flp pilus assembly protein TadB